MANPHDDQKILQWLNKEINESQIADALSENELLAYKQIIEEVDQWTPDNDNQIFDIKTITSNQDSKVRRVNTWMPVSIAASVFFALVAGWFFFASSPTVYSSQIGEVRTITLPDSSSKATLAPNSEISWNDDDWTANSRSLELIGNAFFKVSSGHPFVVSSNNGKVEVLGTQFEVDVYSNSMFVAVNEGRVKATSSNGQVLILSGDESSLFDSRNWEDKSSIEGAPSWLSGQRSTFNNAPLNRVLKTLERVYNIQVKSEGVNLDRRFTGSFPHDDLETAVRIIVQPFGLNFEIEEQVLILTE